MKWLKEKLKNKYLRWLLVGAALAAVTAGGFALVFSLLDPMDCRMAPGVTIGGLEVGGMTPGQARAALKNAAEEQLYARELELVLPGQTLTFSRKELSLRLNVHRAVRDAYRIGRDTLETKALGISDYLHLDEAVLRQALAEYAAQYDTELTQLSWQLEKELPSLSTGELEGTEVPPVLLLTLGTPECHLDPEDVLRQLGQWFDGCLSGREGAFVPVIPAQQLPRAPDLAQIDGEIRQEPVDDRLDLKTYALVPGSYGCQLKLEDAEKLVPPGAYGETLRLPMVYIPPQILGDGVYFRDVLGSSNTKHTADENRNTNLKLVCQFLDGKVIQPGEEFSYNAAVGERTEERGFKPATVYSGSFMSKDYGGGVCQGSTTLYNCLLLADMEILVRFGHGALVNYVPLGLDAAVNWSTDTDLVFRNNSHFPVKIQAEVSGGYMRMQLLGTDEKDYYIKMETTSAAEGEYYYATSYKCKYDKQTDQLISRKVEARSVYVAQLDVA